MKRSRWSALAAVVFIGVSSAWGPHARPMLMRFPVVSTDRMAFVAYGNLWTVARKGGIATSLTNDPGQVLSPHFSPDGRSIAFTWQREGGSDVYVIPSSGGAPVRLTHGPTLDGYANIVVPTGPEFCFCLGARRPFTISTTRSSCARVAVSRFRSGSVHPAFRVYRPTVIRSLSIERSAISRAIDGSTMSADRRPMCSFTISLDLRCNG